MTTHSNLLAITPGEPAGIGPDLVLELASRASDQNHVAVGSMEMLQQRSKQLGLDLHLVPYEAELPEPPLQSTFLRVLDIPLCSTTIPGQLDSANGPYVLDTLTRATKGCLDGEFAAMVTAPVHKGIINDAGIVFSGHTEFLAELCGGMLPVMMLATDGLRVALATTHLPLKDVSEAITNEGLEQVLRILHHDLNSKFGISDPHILVCGLNPHAGEGGHLGSEEIDTIIPVLERLRSEGMDLIGPLPADTLFTPRNLDGADAVLAMFHDQGLPVLKHVGFGNAVNITLGLPIIRTSVDHGTALDLAGTGKASSGSLEAALRYAENMVAARRS